MAVNKGLKSLSESTPNFSNQGLENAINNLKIGWVAKSIQLDTAIEDSTVLTTSQKNDLRDDIDNVPHLNIGRYLGELVRHTNTIIDGSIIPGNSDITGTPEDQGQGSFLEILQLVQSLQSLIPELLGVTPGEKNRAVNDHLGSLNNIFLETEDSSQPVFTSLQEAITFINDAGLATDTTYQSAIDDLKNFVVGLSGDSTDFQTSLDNRATTLATAQTNFNNALASEPYLTKRTQLVNNRASIVTQKTQPTETNSTRNEGNTALALDAETLALQYPTFESVLEVIRKFRDMKLLIDVENSIRLSSYIPGRIEFTPAENAPTDLAQRLGKLLQNWTGFRWAITVVSNCSAETIQERRNAEEAQLKNEAKLHPFVKTVFENFPKASITEIKSQAQIITEAEETRLPEIEGEWDPFEE